MNCQLKSTDPQHNKNHEVAFHPHRGYSFEVKNILGIISQEPRFGLNQNMNGETKI